MTPELAKELKKAGFPEMESWMEGSTPTLEELIEACGEEFDMLMRERSLSENMSQVETIWYAHGLRPSKGATPVEAVARLWLRLNDVTIKDNEDKKGV